MPAAEVPVSALDALLLEWIAVILAEEARHRHVVATGLDEYVITFCETAIAKLHEVTKTLLHEPRDVAETIYADMLEMVPLGLGPAASLVNTLFNGHAPLVGAIAVAGDLVHDTFYFPLPDGGPLQGALRDLGHLIHVPHANAGHLFTAYADNLGVIPEGIWELWEDNHVQACDRAMEALERLEDTVWSSLEADDAVHLCQGEWEKRLPPSELVLQRTISLVDEALVLLRLMRINLVALDQIMLYATDRDPLPPSP